MVDYLPLHAGLCGLHIWRSGTLRAMVDYLLLARLSIWVCCLFRPVVLAGLPDVLARL
jgi:hypothetical protein